MPDSSISRRETARLRAIRHLGVPGIPASGFGLTVARAAASLVGVPISAVSIVDQYTVHFASSCGLSAKEIPRDIGFCSHTVLGTDPFIVRDLRLDARFCTNPLVLGAPHARFYAGFPLVVAGHSVGALCVIDDRPRELTPELIERLSTLAAGTAAWLAIEAALEGSEA